MDDHSLASFKIIGISIAPQFRIVVESFLEYKILKKTHIKYITIAKIGLNNLIARAFHFYRFQGQVVKCGEDNTLPCCRQSSLPASILHLHIQNFPCDSKQESLVNQIAVEVLDFYSTCVDDIIMVASP